MKNFISSFLLGFALLEVHGQVNLVQNPSFEEYSECPNDNNGSLIEQAIYWSNPNIYSPDYFNSCDQTTNQNYSIPQNYFGYQIPRTGNAYVGIITAIEGVDSREYIQNELSNPLVQGKKYCVKFFVSTADNSKYASNDIGAYFSEIPLNYSSTNNIDKVPQISNDPNLNSLSHKIEWIEVSGCFVAQGGEKYMIIGNFKNEANTDTSHFNDNTSYRSYHYIDDIEVIIHDEASVVENKVNPISTFPNPVEDFLIIETKNLSLKNVKIINGFGIVIEVLDQIQISEDNKIKIEMSKFPKGIYFLSIETNNESITKKIIKN